MIVVVEIVDLYMNKINILRLIGVLLMIPSTGSLILWLSGLLDIIYLAIINWIMFLVEFIIFLVIVKNSAKENNSNVIITKALCKEKVINAEANIFSDFLIPTNPRKDCIFRVSLQIEDFKNPPMLSMIRICGKDTCVQELNKNIILDREFIHVFEVEIDKKERLNFKFDENVTIKSILIEELYVV